MKGEQEHAEVLSHHGMELPQRVQNLSLKEPVLKRKEDVI